MTRYTTSNHRSAVQRIAVARMISMAGSEAAFIALMALIYERTGSAYWASAALAGTIGVVALASPVAGTIGDRYDRRVVMIVSDIAAAVGFLALVVAESPLAIVVLVTLASLAETPFMPASKAAVPNLVPEDELTWANATIGMWRTAGAMAGPLLGGVLVAAVGAEAAFAVNALSFVASAALVWSVRGRFSASADERAERSGLGAGFAFMWHDRLLRTMTVAWFVFLAGVGVLLVAEYPLAESFDVGSVGYGLIVAAWGAGALAGAQAAKKFVRRDNEVKMLAVTAAVMAVAIMSVAGILWFPLVLVAMIVGGVANGLANVAEELVLQHRTPDAVRSRVFAAMEAVVIVSLTASFAAAGPLLELTGPRAAYLLAGLAGLFAAAILMTLVREERAPAAATAPAEST